MRTRCNDAALSELRAAKTSALRRFVLLNTVCETEEDRISREIVAATRHMRQLPVHRQVEQLLNHGFTLADITRNYGEIERIAERLN